MAQESLFKLTFQASFLPWKLYMTPPLARSPTLSDDLELTLGNSRTR
ncbi:BnaC03g62900D [Brassica napus]|uniref:BnaC03g62900D protein n=1 Tax=Brassica napus TaxID=3708 RepID=A0A078F443_BRANA|nr:BnaC03g62900D [Brassica napus]